MVRKIANNVNPMNVVKQIIHILNDASAKKKKKYKTYCLFMLKSRKSGFSETTVLTSQIFFLFIGHRLTSNVWSTLIQNENKQYTIAMYLGALTLINISINITLRHVSTIKITYKCFSIIWESNWSIVALKAKPN